jgi:hypothetical protein
VAKIIRQFLKKFTNDTRHCLKLQMTKRLLQFLGLQRQNIVHTRNPWQNTPLPSALFFVCIPLHGPKDLSWAWG